MMSDTQPFTPPDWVRQIQARGLDHALSVALDIFEPLGPLGAQLVWVAQPVLSAYLPREALDDLAELLERPGGIEQMRQWLEERGNRG